MVWFKVDDKLHDHRKARAAGKSAMGLWVLAGSWSADHLTDGFVPATVLPRWGTRGDAAKLVRAGLWHVDEQDGEKGWRFHEWESLQPTRAQKLAEREAKAEAGRVGGKASGRSRREAKSKQSASQGAGRLVEHPTRPDPTRAAAAAGERGSGSDEAAPSKYVPVGDLPVGIDILRSKLQQHTVLRALRFDQLSPTRVAELEDLCERYPDQQLVDVALRTCGPTPPRSVAGFIGTWQSMPPPGQRLHVVTDDPCTRPGHTGTVRHCNQCASEQKAAR